MPRLRFFITIIALAIVGYFAYAHQLWLEATIWHWRHGYSAQVGQYEIPVPKGWIVQYYADHRSLDLINTRVNRHAEPFEQVSLIAIDSSSFPVRDLERWKDAQKWRLSSEGVTKIEEKTLQVDNHPLECVGGRELGTLLKQGVVKVMFLQCQSTAPLGLMYFGPETTLGEFYAIASGIHGATAK